MFSGKSVELLRLVEVYTVAQKKCLLIKYSKDTRYTDEERVETHNGQSHEAISTASLANLQISDDVGVIAIDEGQFFGDLLQFCEQMINRGKVVIVTALSGDFLRKPWPSVSETIPLASNLRMLKAVCRNCYNENASFTHRITSETEVEVIGGVKMYKPLCGTCYHRSISNQNGQSI